MLHKRYISTSTAIRSFSDSWYYKHALTRYNGLQHRIRCHFSVLFDNGANYLTIGFRDKNHQLPTMRDSQVPTAHGSIFLTHTVTAVDGSIRNDYLTTTV